MIKQYWRMMKPNIVFGNIISLSGGFLLASKGNIDYVPFIVLLISMSLVIASSCIFNNYIDRNLDSKMERTRNRALVKGLISPKTSLKYATLLGFTGFMLLWFSANRLSFLLCSIGFVLYVGIYSLRMKHYSIYSTIVGSISGSLPPVIGYCAVTNNFDKAAFILLVMFGLWQIPHFYAIVIFRLKDYQTANIPVLPVVKGINVAKNHIVFYIIAFTISTIMLVINGYVGIKYLTVTTILNIWWIFISINGQKSVNDRIWARKIFLLSIVVITLSSVMMSVDFKEFNS